MKKTSTYEFSLHKSKDMSDNPLDELDQNEWDALIYSILRPFHSFCTKDALVTPEDLQQEAWISLLQACDRYDPSRAKFVTFAYHYIRGHVLRYIGKRTKNKPHQIDEDPIILDSRQYLEDKVEQEDLRSTIFDKVADQPHADLLIEHFIHDKSMRQIAREQGVSHQLIKVRVDNLIDLLQIRLKNENA